MGAVDIGGGRQHGKKGKRKKKHRIGIRLDMTPLVDVAFLLLTFFMLTTTFSLPQVMEITLPPSETKSEVTESSLMLLRLMENGTIFWNMGTESPRALEANTLRAFLKERINTNPNLITLVKVDRKSKYSNMVKIIDELHLANITRYSLAPLLEPDKKIVEEAAGKS